MEGIFYVLPTGCQWKAVPREYGSGSVVHARFQEWQQQGVFEKLWEQGLHEYDELEGIAWKFQSMDGGMNKAPLGGGKTGEKLQAARSSRTSLEKSRRARLTADMAQVTIRHCVR
jgi:transposase